MDSTKNSGANSGKKKRGRVENLRPFKPGQSGNPGGRPRKKWVTEVLEEMLKEKLSDPRERKAFKDAIWEKLKSQRVVGSMTLETVLERTEGKAAQPVEVNGEIALTLAERMKKAEERLLA